ncbi:urea amidolyase associated protein UAAP1 [Microbacterium sp. 18062]|uniref:urea amidolyase associated protein UAAP1 n=1 Tax=Microbacterium sp. 18062 TaxID=2681410 RepID=UPI00135C8066|nr:urea amidolyase associated protein UAAP1 [Microbacterium sp. 18062]
MSGRIDELDSVERARADARSRSTRSEWMPYLPPHTAPFAPADVDPGVLRWAETVAPGGYAHLRVARGTRIRLEDVTGDACAHVLVFNAVEPGERLNVADTQKIPWQAYLGAGHPLLSGDGRVLATIVADTSGHHDAFCGTSSDAWNEQRYGDAHPEGASPSGHALLRLAGAKHGLTVRDLPPAVTLFQGVRVDADGSLAWRGSAGPGASVDLRAELPLIVLVANVPHPLDPRDDYVVGPLRVTAWAERPTDERDDVFALSPERERAYRNTIAYAELAGL